MSDLAAGLRIHRPTPGVLAFYDGRVPGKRLMGPHANWVDDGAYVLGTASYAIVDGPEALVYDAHITLDHAAAVRRALQREGVHRITLVLSHWHLDHVAGNAAFADCSIVANRLTDRLLRDKRNKIEAGLQSGLPAISPLVLPTRIFDGVLELTVGSLKVQLMQIDSHSIDGTVAWMPHAKVLLAGDTLEDPVTYVAEAGRLEAHLAGLDALEALAPACILPNHGDEHVIAAGGYDGRLIAANRAYVRRLLSAARSADSEDQVSLEVFIAPELAAGGIRYFDAYEPVHRRNLEAVAKAAGVQPSLDS